MIKEQAQSDLRFVRLLRPILLSVMDSKKFLSDYKKIEQALTRACEFDEGKPQDQAANLDKVAQRLQRMGAKRIDGRKH